MENKKLKSKSEATSHNTLVVMNYHITDIEQDEFFYCEFRHLKKYLSRAEVMSLVKSVFGVNGSIYNQKGYGHQVVTKKYIVTMI